MRKRIQRLKNNYNYTTNKVELIRGGTPYFSLLNNLIAAAKHSIHLQTYIFEDDETGKSVANALIEAAKRNVDVYLLVDGYASQNLASDFIESLISSGINFRFFEPLFKSRNFYFGRRLHSKVLVTDASSAVVGGVNITNRYNDMPGKTAWLDFALFVEGPAAMDAYKVCVGIWKGKKRRNRGVALDSPVEPGNIHPAQAGWVRVRRNDWVNNRLQISNSYLEMFRTAVSHITILSSYALPGNIFRRNLEKALKRGVKIRMIISGQSDVVLVKQAEKYWYNWLFRNNIEIFEYTKNVLHGKLAICDGEWMTIGSYNVNDLSAYVSVELNFDVRDPHFVAGVEHILQKIIDNDCVKIQPDKFVHTSNVFKKLGRWVAYVTIRLTFSLFTFYYRKQK
jgi:cardiolipin synthase A/B